MGMLDLGGGSTQITFVAPADVVINSLVSSYRLVRKANAIFSRLINLATFPSLL